MAVKPPLIIKEQVRLDRFVRPDAISFQTISVEGDKHFTVLDKNEQKVNIFSFHKINMPDKRNCPADFAIMHPTKQIMAVTAGTTIQMLDIAQRSKVADVTLQQPIVFWKWLNEHILGLVTQNSVFHFDLNNPSQAPRRVFDRNPDLQQAQIISYKMDPTEKWVALIGLVPYNGEAGGKIQLFSMEKNASQMLDGHAAHFYHYKHDGCMEPSVMFAFAQKHPSPRLGMIEVVKGDPSRQNMNKMEEMQFSPQQQGDFIVGMTVSEKFETILCISRMGFLYAYYSGDGSVLFMGKAIDDQIFLTAHNAKTDGIIAIGKKGGVTNVSIEGDKLVGYICNGLKNVGLGC